LLTNVLPPPRNLKVLGKVYINSNKIRIGNNVTLYPGVFLWGNDIEIGDNVDIGIGTIIFSMNGVKIGSDTLISGQCYIIDSNHNVKKDELIRCQSLDSSNDGIFIGEDVWIGTHSTILKGAKINSHAVIGANSLVNKEIPSNAIAFGTPAIVKLFRK